MTTTGRRQQQMHEFAGIDLEKDVNHVVAFMQAEPATKAPDAGPQPPRVLVLAQGKFEQPRVEQFIKDHGGDVEDYHGKHLMIRRPEAPSATAEPSVPDPNPNPQIPHRFQPEIAVGFVQPDLIAIGPADLVRQAMDASSSTANITSNTDLMALMRDETSANAWVVGNFDAVSRRMGLPSAVRTQVPPLRLVSASAHIDGGVKARIKAQTADSAAADQLRDVVRGAISFAKLQAGSKPELESALKTVELGGTGTNVQLSFMMTMDSLRALNPHGPPAGAPTPPPQR
jgi:hypothetical protein